MHLSVGVHLNSGEKKCSIFGEDLFFWSSPELGEKSVPFLVKNFFFGLHLICSPEQNRGRGSSPPMLNKDRHPCPDDVARNLPLQPVKMVSQRPPAQTNERGRKPVASSATISQRTINMKYLEAMP